MQLIARQILLTLAYTTQFSYPLLEKEMSLRYIQASEQKTPPTEKEIRTALEWLKKQGFIAEKNGYLFLPGREADVIVRQERAAASTKKLAEIKPLVMFAKLIPWVHGVALTGSTAMRNAASDDDTDLLIVTAPHRLWLVRPLFIFFAYLFGKRRSWQKEEKNSWCFNLWLEETALAQPKASHSLYTAYEICQTEWLLSTHACKNYFFFQNQWVRRYLPNYFSKRTVGLKMPAPRRETNGTLLLDLLNSLCFKLQLWYMKPHMTREKVALNYAFFHPRDTRRVITLGLKKILTGKDIIVLVTGVFDLLHSEHRRFLEKAKAVGDKLVIGMESDARVRQMKGEGRPVQDQKTRLANLTALHLADEIFVLPEAFSKPEHHRALLAQVKPDVLAVSSHSPYLEAKQRLMQEIGGTVMIVHQHNPAVSTTQIIKERQLTQVAMR